MNKFYVYKIGGLSCVKINKGKDSKKTFDLTTCMNPSKASYWTSKKTAKSWEKYIKNIYPMAELAECELTFKERL